MPFFTVTATETQGAFIVVEADSPESAIEVAKTNKDFNAAVQRMEDVEWTVAEDKDR